MSALTKALPGGTTRRLEPVLRYLATNNDAKVTVAAAKFLPEGAKLADFNAEIWLWLKTYNMGKREFTTTRLEAVLAHEGTTPPAAPAAKARVEKAMARAIVRKPAPTAVGYFDADTKADPWTKRPRRVRATALAKWRPRLVALANGEKSALEGGGHAWDQVRRKWFGTPRPAPAMVERFLEWADQGADKLPRVKIDTINDVAKTVTTGRRRRKAKAKPGPKPKKHRGRKPGRPAKVTGHKVRGGIKRAAADLVALAAELQARVEQLERELHASRREAAQLREQLADVRKALH